MSKNRVPLYAGPTCRGSYVLGSACGRCEKCAAERHRIRLTFKVRRISLDFTLITDMMLQSWLYSSTTRWVEYRADGLGAYEAREVCVRGKWMQLCRTDLKDDIRTSGLIDWNNGRAYVRTEGSYGARITADTIYVIDQLSDG